MAHRYGVLSLFALLSLLSHTQEERPEARAKLLKTQKASIQKADAGDPFHQYRINSLLENQGQPRKYEYPSILKGFEKLAQTKDPKAIYYFGVLSGSDYPGIDKDVGKRKSLIKEAAQLGYPQAMLEHARYVWEDQKNANLALDWWFRGRQALIEKAEAGDKTAMSELWYLGPPGGLQDHEQIRKLDLFGDGTKWLRRSAETGDSEAMVGLGVRQIDGSGAFSYKESEQAKIEVEGRDWLQKAAEQGHWEAMARLGMVYANGLRSENEAAARARKPYPTDPAKAWYWWDKAIAIVGEEKVMEIVNPGGGGELPPRPNR